MINNDIKESITSSNENFNIKKVSKTKYLHCF